LKYSQTYTASHGGVTVRPQAVDLIRAQLKNRAALRAQKSPAFAKALAKTFQRIDRRASLPRPRPAIGAAGTSRPAGLRPADTAFDPNVAVFAYDDSQGTWLDAQYLNVDTGEFDLAVTEDSPVSLWVGTYDETAGTGDVVLPLTYGFNYELPPAPDDVVFDYNAYMYVDPATIVADDAYVVWTSDQSGYYAVTWDAGTAYFYLLADDVSVGAYYLIWDDGTCAQGTHVYITFDASGGYFSINGVDAPFSMSGVTTTTGYFDGDARWTVVDNDGYNYDVVATVAYLDVAPAEVCPADMIVVPADPAVCPAGCELDAFFGICTIAGTLDPLTGVGVSCDLVDAAVAVIVCPPGCAEAVPSDGFCYDAVTADICY
jgi:hypothetical protein